MSTAAAPGNDVSDDEHHPARGALDALFRADPYARGLGIELVDWGLGWAEVTAVPTVERTNFLGSLHGGFAFSMADVALSYAGNSWGRMSLAISLEIQYVRAGAPGAALRARATCRSRSRRISSFAIDVLDDADRLVATLQGMNYRADGWHLGEDRWPEAWRARF